jgi:hypothetical protein
VLALDLEVREVDWRPDRDDQPGLVVRAFAERGKRASVPGPLIRVPEGTTIVARVTQPAEQRDARRAWPLVARLGGGG